MLKFATFILCATTIMKTGYKKIITRDMREYHGNIQKVAII